jgi:hypothetical protein
MYLATRVMIWYLHFELDNLISNITQTLKEFSPYILPGYGPKLFSQDFSAVQHFSRKQYSLPS